MTFEDHFRAMGTDVDITVEAAQPPLDAFVSARLLFEREEQRFSRFRPDSLLSRLNAGKTVVDATFAAVCRLALTAFEATGGLFNPLVLPALSAAGYDRTFEELEGGRLMPGEVPSLAESLTVRGDEVRLETGSAMDLGGIVKGWAVDQVIELLLDEHPNLLVNAGGDLRAAGSEEGKDGWELAIADPLDPDRTLWEGVMRGALATSTTLKRRWLLDDGTPAHHLIDPRTGLPASSSFVQVSAWADRTWWAEIWAKAVLIGGSEVTDDARRAGCNILAVEARPR